MSAIKKFFPTLDTDNLNDVCGGLHLSRYSIPGASGYVQPAYQGGIAPPTTPHSGGDGGGGFFDGLFNNPAVISGIAGLAGSFFGQGSSQQTPQYTPPRPNPYGGQPYGGQAGNAVQFSAQAAHAIDVHHGPVAQGYVATPQGEMSTTSAANQLAAQTRGAVTYGGDLNRDGLIDAGDFLHAGNVNEQTAANMVGSILDRLHGLAGRGGVMPAPNRPFGPQAPMPASIPGLGGLHLSTPGRHASPTPTPYGPPSPTAPAYPTEPPYFGPSAYDAGVTEQINESVPVPEYPTEPPDFGSSFGGGEPSYGFGDAF